MRLLTALTAAVLSFHSQPAQAASEPFRLAVSPNGSTWSLHQRDGSSWRPVLSDANIVVTRLDGSQVSFDALTLNPGGQSISLSSNDMTLRLIIRWLDEKRLPGVVVLLPEVWAKTAELKLGSISVLGNAIVARTGGKPLVLVNGFGSDDTPQTSVLRADGTLDSWWTTALEDSGRAFVAGYLSGSTGVNSFRLSRNDDNVLITDTSDLVLSSLSPPRDGTSMDAIYLAWGKSPSLLLKQYSAAARAYGTGMEQSARFRNVLNIGPDSRWKGVLEESRNKLAKPWWQQVLLPN